MINDVQKQYVLNTLFEAVTQLLPTLGRDFVVKVEDITEHGVSITIHGMTPLGKAVEQELKANLMTKFKELMAEKEKVYGERKG